MMSGDLCDHEWGVEDLVVHDRADGADGHDPIDPVDRNEEVDGIDVCINCGALAYSLTA